MLQSAAAVCQPNATALLRSLNAVLLAVNMRSHRHEDSGLSSHSSPTVRW